MEPISFPEKSHCCKAARLLLNGSFKLQRLEEAHELAEFLAAACPNSRLAVLGISEIIVNAIEHGNLGITSTEKTKLQSEDKWLSEIEKRLTLPQYQKLYVEIDFTRTDKEILIKVTDQGQGFNWSQSENEDPLALHGRGLLLAKKLSFKRLEYSKKGNEVTCVIALE